MHGQSVLESIVRHFEKSKVRWGGGNQPEIMQSIRRRFPGLCCSMQIVGALDLSFSFSPSAWEREMAQGLGNSQQVWKAVVYLLFSTLLNTPCQLSEVLPPSQLLPLHCRGQMTVPLLNQSDNCKGGGGGGGHLCYEGEFVRK